MNDESEETLRAEIIRLTRLYAGKRHRASLPGGGAAAFEPGVTTVPYAGRVFDADEVEAAVGFLPRFLADARPGRRGVRDANSPTSWE